MESTPKRKKKSTTSSPQPNPKAEEKRAYKALLALRRKVERTAEEVSAAERTLRSARTITASLALRDQAIDQAQEVLSSARAAHAEAVRDFEAARSRR